jgi:acetyltransferase-like isoleucine patch superfamily enzyme
MRYLISKYLKSDSLFRWALFGIYKNPILFSYSLIRSIIVNKKLTGAFYPLRVRIGANQNLKVKISKTAKVSLLGNLIVNQWGGNNINSSISLSNETTLTILGDFEIGPNVHIELAAGANLTLGGKKCSSASGVTCNSRIMVEKSLTIGSDCIIAWDVFISDSNWHEITGVQRSASVIIGNNVWISHGVSILKGVSIPNGCIVGAKSLVTSIFKTENALIAGIPARIVRNDVEWVR